MTWTQNSMNLHVVFRGFLNERDEDDELDFAEFDDRVFGIQSEISEIELNRDPKLETEFMGNNGEFEIMFICRSTWMDRESDIGDYLDKVQGNLENSLDVMINERERLGYSKRN